MVKLRAVRKSAFSSMVCSNTARFKSHWSNWTLVRSASPNSTSCKLQELNGVFLSFRLKKDEKSRLQRVNFTSNKKSVQYSKRKPMSLQSIKWTARKAVRVRWTLLRLHAVNSQLVNSTSVISAEVKSQFTKTQSSYSPFLNSPGAKFRFSKRCSKRLRIRQKLGLFVVASDN